MRIDDGDLLLWKSLHHRIPSESESEDDDSDDEDCKDFEVMPAIPAISNTDPQGDVAISLSTETEEWAPQIGTGSEVLSEDLAFLDKLVRETYPERIKALQYLKNTLQSENVRDYFDEEDRRWVDEDLNRQVEELKNLHQIWKETTSVYENTLLKLARTIQARQKVLSHVDEKTQVFSERPKLVELFAKKQADLSALMDVCKEKIRKEQQEVRDRVTREHTAQLAVLHEYAGENPAQNIPTAVESVKKVGNEKPKSRKAKQKHEKKFCRQ